MPSRQAQVPLQADDADSDEYGPPEEVEVSVDNTTTASYSLVRISLHARHQTPSSHTQSCLSFPAPPPLLLSLTHKAQLFFGQVMCACAQVSVVCRDRKGLVYDLMRTMKDIEVGC